MIALGGTIGTGLFLGVGGAYGKFRHVFFDRVTREKGSFLLMEACFHSYRRTVRTCSRIFNHGSCSVSYCFCGTRLEEDVGGVACD